MASALLLVTLLMAALGQYYDDFTKNTTHWGDFGPGILSTGTPVMMLPKQCHFNSTFSSHSKGLKMVMSHTPCRRVRNNCCRGTSCAKLATCHIAALRSYKFGTFEASIKFAHYHNGSQATNALSYFSAGYTSHPIHNEITLGFDGKQDPPMIHLAYWYNSQMHRHTKPVSFNPYTTFNKYTVEWTPTSIVWKANDKILHTDVGIAGKTIPYLPLSTRIILRPHHDIPDEDVYIEYEYYRYTPN